MNLSRSTPLPDSSSMPQTGQKPPCSLASDIAHLNDVATSLMSDVQTLRGRLQPICYRTPPADKAVPMVEFSDTDVGSALKELHKQLWTLEAILTDIHQSLAL